MSIGVEAGPQSADAVVRDRATPDDGGVDRAVPARVAAPATSPPWGAQRPDVLSRTVIALSRHTPLGRGRMRARLQEFLHRRHPGGLDCTLYGQPMRAYFGDNRCEWKAVLKPAMFDPQERMHIAQALDRPAAVMLDIGANVGIHSLAAASHVRRDARIVAFEPHPETYRRLAFNLASNSFPGFTALQVALGASEDVLHLGAVDLSLTSLIDGGAGPAVQVRPLITCLAELGIEHIDVLKIDVEGYESEVLSPFLAAAPDSLLPQLVVIEALGMHQWEHDCVALLQSRGLEVVARVGNNAIMKIKSSHARN